MPLSGQQNVVAALLETVTMDDPPALECLRASCGGVPPHYQPKRIIGGPAKRPRATRRQPPNLQSCGTLPAPSRAAGGAALHHSRSLQIPHHGWDDGYRAGSPSARVLGADIRHFRFAPTSFSEALDIASATCYAARCWGGGSQLLAGVIDDAEVNDASRPSTAEQRLDSRPLNYAPVGS